MKMAALPTSFYFLLCLIVFSSVNEMVQGKACICTKELGKCTDGPGCIQLCHEVYKDGRATCTRAGDRVPPECQCSHACPCRV
ncbi:hypothetical protein CASFOL_026973 [Castilleja foliolosa]|uniref:Uncharacterized protein n=1 Tax=Castilleja foliolosa TaxID=1961234 RepID=A0ABD3CIM2_9LAMI